MSILTRKPKPDPTLVYVAAVSFAYASPGAPTSIHRGARLRGDNAIVVSTFEGGLWAPDGLDDAEMVAFRRELTTPTPPPAPPAPPAPDPVRKMVCVKVVTLSAQLVAGGVASYLVVQPGEVLPSNHVAVVRHPRSFEPADVPPAA